jgi:hypothetical protein
MYLQKVTSRKNCVNKLVFCWLVNDENSRLRIQNPDPDPLVRGMDPRIRIHTKMSWIRNTAGKQSLFFSVVWSRSRFEQFCQMRKFAKLDLQHVFQFYKIFR